MHFALPRTCCSHAPRAGPSVAKRSCTCGRSCFLSTTHSLPPKQQPRQHLAPLQVRGPLISFSPSPHPDSLVDRQPPARSRLWAAMASSASPSLLDQVRTSLEGRIVSGKAAAQCGTWRLLSGRAGLRARAARCEVQCAPSAAPPQRRGC
jgi:hypothetical protein